MSPLAAFLQVLLHEGRAVFRDRPEPAHPDDMETMNLLRRSYAGYRLEVAGPPLEFSERTAFTAAALVRHACWYVISHNEPESELEQTLAPFGPPRSPAEHLSADMLFRMLPQVYRRARAHDPTDRLTALLAETLRRWPLSGVLADLDEEPLTPIDFSGHTGLMMLYAERLAQHPKDAWTPAGKGLEYLELVRGPEEKTAGRQ